MTIDTIILFLHVLGWVLWLGTDLGVFITAKATENTSYTVETRLVLLDMVLKIDKIPRVSVPIVFITGICLAHNYGVTVIPLSLGLTLGFIWLGIALVAITNHPSTSLGKMALLLNLLGFAGVLFGMGGLGILSLAGADTMPTWLAAKWIAFAWAAFFSIGIDFALKPAIQNYVRLEKEGASDEVNAALSSSLQKVYITVLCVYIGTIVAAFLGINKIF